MNCEKKNYNSYKEAMDAISHISVKHKQGFRVYKCPECGLFHITSVPNKKLIKQKDNKYPLRIEKKKDITFVKPHKLKTPPNKNKKIETTFKLIDQKTADVLKRLIDNNKYLH